MGKGGKMTAGGSEEASELLSSEQFRPFLADGFDAASFASRSLSEAHTTAQAQTEALQSGVSALEGALRSLVLRHQDELISQTARLAEAESSVHRIALSVRSLQLVAARVRGEVAEPYAQIAARTRQLRNLQATVDLLRHVIHRLKLVQKLRSQMAAADSAGILEVAKAAKLLSEIAAVDAEADMSGVEAVDADAEFLQTAAAIVRSQTEAALKAGLECLSQADVGSALQVLFNLGELKEGVLQLADQAAASFGRELSAALDPRKLSASSVAAGGGGKGPGGAKGPLHMGGPAGGTAAKVQDLLWEKLGRALEQLQRSAVEVWHLQRVLAKKRDPLTHTLFLDVAAPGEGDPLPLDRFWSRAIAAMTDAFAATFGTARGGFVRDSLVAGYPRLAALLEGAAARVLRDSAARDVAPALDEEQTAAVLDSAGDFQNAYLAAALARLSEAASAAFPGSSRALPTAADLQKSIARVHEELKAASGSPRLALQVSATVGKALGMMAQKAEYMAASGPDLRSAAPGAACNSAQLRNISLCNCLQEVHRGVGGLLGRLPPGAAEALQGPLGELQAAAVEAVAPTFRAMVDGAEELILQMHATPAYTAGAGGGAGDAAAGGGTVTDTSAYMRDLARQLAHYRLEFLTKFSPSPASPVPSVARALVERMAARLVLFAVRHASLLRPLPQAGKLQLAKDLAELEAAVGTHLLPLEQLGGPARALRAFRRLLFLEAPDLEASPLLRELPRPEVLHHLYSRAPAQLESPHARSGLTPAQYSLWLDGHSQEEALKFIRTALDACVAKARGAPGADDLLPLMRRLATASTG